MIESKYLQDNIRNIQQMFAIPALKNFEASELARLVRLSKVRQYEDGETVIREGDTDPWIYFLLQGAVRIEKQGIEISRMSKMGELFGEMRILDSQSRSASVIAVGKTVCLAVNVAVRDRLPTDDAPTNLLLLLYRVFAEYVSVRLRLANERLVEAHQEVDALKARVRAAIE
jgi:CRP/FNR family cyclic AMP-dependent transcriptional regulator